MVIIGSQAIKYHFPDFKREPKDYDIVVQSHDAGKVYDFMEKWYGKVEKLTNPIIAEFDHGYLDLDSLYTLKISHAFWNINWEKHLFDIIFLRDKGCKFNRELFNKLYDYWNKVHGENKKSDLKMSAEDFFDNAIKHPIPHDTIHEILNPEPIYKKILKNDGTVDTDDNKFNQLSYEDKIKLIQEETMVMAAERQAGRDYRTAYKWMLKKLIINHLPIEQGIFAIMNHKELIRPPFNYIEKIEQWKKNQLN